MACLTDVGECFTWGEDTSKTGKLGYAPRAGVESAVPREVKKLSEAGHVPREISCGGDHTAAITEAGLVVTWGSNADGQLGFENLEVLSLTLTLSHPNPNPELNPNSLPP